MSKKKPLSRNVRTLGFVSLFNDLSSEITIRTLPLYLANVLGAKTAVIGLIEGIADSTSTILKIFSGWFSDAIGRRRSVVLSGYSLSAFSKPFLFFAASWPVVLLIRFADRVGKGVRTSPRDALIADSSPPEERGRAFGYNRMMDPIGGTLGLLIAAGVVIGSGGEVVRITEGIFRTLVLISIIPALVSVILLIAFVRDIHPGRPAAIPTISMRGFDADFKRFLLILLLFTLGNSSDAFLILRAQHAGLNLLEIFLMIALFNMISSLVSLPAGLLSDRFGRRRLINFGWLVYALIYAGFAFATSGLQIWILYCLYGVYYGATEGVEKALVADLAPAEKRGTAFGVYHTAVGVAALPASLIAGLLWQWFGAAAPFLFGAGLSVAAAICLGTLVKR